MTKRMKKHAQRRLRGFVGGSSKPTTEPDLGIASGNVYDDTTQKKAPAVDATAISKDTLSDVDANTTPPAAAPSVDPNATPQAGAPSVDPNATPTVASAAAGNPGTVLQSLQLSKQAVEMMIAAVSSKIIPNTNI